MTGATTSSRSVPSSRNTKSRFVPPLDRRVAARRTVDASAIPLGVLMGDVIHAGIFELELWKTVGPLTNEGAKLHVMKALGR